ncbi:MAG: YhbY family RNA-binding protein [Treponema sp.]|nr:YhbY family RNA-binding protein [Treponema sp.]
MILLNSKQRKLLEKEAQKLHATVIVGQNGVTDSLIEMVKDTLKIHELVKISFNEYKEEKRDLSEEIANKSDSTLVRVIGNKAIFYKAAEKSDKQKYEKGLRKLQD